MTTLFVMTKGAICKFFSLKVSQRNVAFRALALVPELCVSGAQAASELKVNLCTVFFDGR